MLGARRAGRRGTPADVLVLGLGNPGTEYRGSRHNLGVEVVEELARRANAALKKSRQRALTAEISVSGKRVVLAFAQTFVNLTGEAASLLVRRYGIDDAANIIVVHDELDLPTATVRVKSGGGLAGHNGLRSLKQHLHTDAFARVRIGVGKPPAKEQGADHVLRRVSKSDRTQFDVSVQVAADAVEAIIADGIDAAMNRFNGS